jgi:hypothetical protein
MEKDLGPMEAEEANDAPHQLFHLSAWDVLYILLDHLWCLKLQFYCAESGKHLWKFVFFWCDMKWLELGLMILMFSPWSLKVLTPSSLELISPIFKRDNLEAPWLDMLITVGTDNSIYAYDIYIYRYMWIYVIYMY